MTQEAIARRAAKDIIKGYDIQTRIEMAIKEALAQEQEPTNIERHEANIQKFLGAPQQPEQEPVAWRAPNWGHGDDEWAYRDFDDPVLIADGKPSPNNEALYTTPPQRKPLTYGQIRDLWARDNGLEDCNLCKIDDFIAAVRFVEAAHGIKENT